MTRVCENEVMMGGPSLDTFVADMHLVFCRNDCAKHDHQARILKRSLSTLGSVLS